MPGLQRPDAGTIPVISEEEHYRNGAQPKREKSQQTGSGWSIRFRHERRFLQAQTTFTVEISGWVRNTQTRHPDLRVALRPLQLGPVVMRAP